jgi:SAM-dependent methyltransferase
VPQDAYPAETWHGMARFSRPMYDHQLIPAWLPALGLTDALTRGVRWADVGCGAGHALHRLAETFPNSTFVGYDQFPGQLELANANGVRFAALDAAEGLPERYDVISAFDVVHDAADPPRLLRAIREALNPGGTFVLLEMLSADDPAANVGPVATIMYGVSVLYCMSTSLADGGHGLGTYGLPAARVRELCLEAGFSSVEAFPPQDPFNALYAVRP